MTPVRLLAVLLTLAAVIVAGGGPRAEGQAGPPVASGFDFAKFPTPQPACTGAGLRQSPYLARQDCGFGEVTLAGVDAGATVQAVLRDAANHTLATVAATHDSGDVWQYDIAPETDWPAGPVTVLIKVGGTTATGTGTFFVNTLGAELAPEEKSGGYRPGDAIPVTGEIFEQRSVGTDTQQTGVPATFKIRVVDSAGRTAGTTATITAAGDGSVDATIPGSVTDRLEPGKATNYRETLSLQLVDAAYDDPSPLAAAAGRRPTARRRAAPS